jgi:alanyl-tRNA synthetase
LNSTGEIGVFKILSESSTSSGVRRIEAVAGEPGFNFIQKNLNTFNDIQLHFKQKQSTIFEFLMSLDKNLKQKEKQLKTSNKSNGKINIDKIIDNCSYIDNIKVVIEYFENLEKKQLSSLADDIKNTTHGVSILLSNINGKSYIIMSVFKDLTNIINSNDIVKEIAKLVNGNGGGRPDFAQAGGNPIKNFKTTKKGILDILNRYIK